MASSLHIHSLKQFSFSVHLSVGLQTQISALTLTTTSTSKPSQSRHPATISAIQGTWFSLMPLLLTITPPLLHPPEQRWGGLLQTASAPPVAPTRAAATGRSSSSSSSGRTSTCSLWVGQRAGRVRRSNECEWTAGWHKALQSHDDTPPRQTQNRHCYANEMWILLMCSVFFKLSLFVFFKAVRYMKRGEQH